MSVVVHIPYKVIVKRTETDLVLNQRCTLSIVASKCHALSFLKTKACGVKIESSKGPAQIVPVEPGTKS